ncbi:MAG TPA: DUF1761 domain-containing protein [Xanthobacteraceae bacterium]|nr:DUF1761 domain-containing protein [Xanthobacteraceae bacterium]
MQFAGLNFLAIFLAAVAGWLIGTIYYMIFSKPWVEAQGDTMAAFRKRHAAKVAAGTDRIPFVLSFLCQLVMAWVLAAVIGHLGPGQVTARNGIITALVLFAGFVFTTMLVNNAFASRRAMLTLIDGGHWLAIMVAMGFIIGGFG